MQIQYILRTYYTPKRDIRKWKQSYHTALLLLYSLFLSDTGNTATDLDQSLVRGLAAVKGDE